MTPSEPLAPRRTDTGGPFQGHKTKPLFLGYPDPPELEQYESIVPEVTTVSLFSLIAMSKEIRCKPLVEVKSCRWPKSSRASLAPHLCRVRGDFTLRLSPVAALLAPSPPRCPARCEPLVKVRSRCESLVEVQSRCDRRPRGFNAVGVTGAGVRALRTSCRSPISRCRITPGGRCSRSPGWLGSCW